MNNVRNRSDEARLAAAFPRRGAPWTLAGLAGIVVVLVALFGSEAVVNGISIGLVALFVAYFLRHLGFAASAMRLSARGADVPVADLGFRPAVTVLVPCKNEEAVVEGMVASLIALDYPSDRLQLVVIDDGSTDRTGMLLDELSRRHSNLECIHRTGGGGGKSGALNTGLKRATGEVVVVFDADHRPRTDVVSRLVRHFQDPGVGAVQGRCVIANGDESPLAALVALDYLAGYLVNENGRQAVYQLPAYGGANCAVRTSVLRQLGGWNVNSVTEDTDLTLRLVLAGYRVRYDISAVDEEQGVATIVRYWRQRYRWARGHQQVWRDYRRAVWRSRRLSAAEKLETTMFLLAFHVPVASALGLGILALWLTGTVHPVEPMNASVLWTLLFLGPLLELGGALLVASAPRRQAFGLVWFLPIFIVSIALCSKAWLDGVAGRRYAWAKTARSPSPPPVLAGVP